MHPGGGKKKKMPSASKCPIKCKWHLEGWTGSVHLSVDQSCTRQVNVTAWVFSNPSSGSAETHCGSVGDSRTKSRAQKTTKGQPEEA